MKQRSRTRRILKWVGASVCAAALVLFVVSTQVRAWYTGPNWVCYLHTGDVIFYYWGRQPSSLQESARKFWYPTGWYAAQEDTGLIGRYWLYFEVPRLGNGTVVVPLWFAFLLGAAPVVVLWYRDRRPPKGHCQKCGYDLTGNVSGVCPECGEPTERQRLP